MKIDAFADAVLDSLKGAGGAELEACVLNAKSPKIIELSAALGYPTDVRTTVLKQPGFCFDVV